jgi:hypothetical protein
MLINMHGWRIDQPAPLIVELENIRNAILNTREREDDDLLA